MANQSIESQIQARVAQFTDDLTQLIRAAAVESVAEVLGTGRRRPTARKAKPAARKTGPRKKKGQRIRRTMADINRLTGKLHTYVKANKGQRLEEISAGMKVSSKDLKRPVAMLLEQGALRKEGERRGTSYFTTRAPRK